MRKDENALHYPPPTPHPLPSLTTVSSHSRTSLVPSSRLSAPLSIWPVEKDAGGEPSPVVGAKEPGVEHAHDDKG